MTLALRSARLWAAAALILLPALALAADRHARPPKPGQFHPEHQTVEMFGAIEKGQIQVKLIPKDSTECRVMIENKTDQPLNVKLPEAFAGVSVLAQVGGMGGMGGGMGGMGMGGGQGMGGGMGGMGMGGMGGMGGGGMGMFNVAPEKVGQLKVTTVCLEHGKPEPRPAMHYEIRPIESLTDKPEVRELCKLLGTGQIPQRAAQVAAWHLNNNMSLEELAAKQIRYANGTGRPYFSPQELQAGMKLVAVAAERAKQRPQQSPGESDAAGQP